MKKIINYASIFLLIVSLVVPSLTFAGGISISTSAANLTTGGNAWSNSVNAKPGDEIAYSTKVYNSTSAPATGLNFRVALPSTLQYVNGSSKLYYKDTATDTDKVAVLADSIVANGASITDIPSDYFVYVSYKVRVASNASMGTYAAGNQVFGTGINVSTNNANVLVSGSAVVADNNQTVVTTQDGQQSTSANIAAALYNLTKGETNYSVSTSANPGDEIMYRIKLTNTGTTPLTGLNARIQLPSGFEYVKDYSRALFVENGAEKQIALNDAIIGNGTTLPINVSVSNYIYIVYKVKVASNAVLGTYGTGNQVWGANGINVSANNATVTVGGAPQVPDTSANIAAALYNLTKGETNYSVSTSANPGDEIMYRIKLTNTGTTPLTGLNARIQLPSGFEYVKDYSRALFVENGAEKQIALNDAIIGNGTTLPINVSVSNYIYIVYKVKVASNAVLGTYGTGNQVWGANGINVSANNATVMVNGSSPIVPVTNGLSINATAYNSTIAANVAYSNAIDANRGDVIKFRVAFANNGKDVLKNAKITNSLPANMEYIAGSAKTTINGTTVTVPDNKTVSLGDLSVGANGILEFSAKVNVDTPKNTAQLVYSADGIADGISQVSSVVNIYLDKVEQLPSTGPIGTILALIVLAMFISVASYMYLKESNALKSAAKLIKR